MAKPLSPIEGEYLYWRNDNRSFDRNHKSGAWYKGQMARARRRHCRREIMEALEHDLIEHADLWRGMADT